MSKDERRSEKEPMENEDDVVDEGIEFEDDEATPEEKLRQLRTKLKECQKEKQAYLDGWQREKADNLNIKKRQQEEIARAHARTQAEHVKKLLPLCDSFSMAMNDANWEKTDPTWRKGIEQIYEQLQRILTEYGVETIGVEGEVFDPHIHEAVSNVPVSTEQEHNTVTSVYQKGYVMEDELIRPAKVIVGEFTNET